ncbi:hypothetical protein [Cobetia marina]|uniref:hypothetical protein n=1 Tax=Cobetia marina TaxID=28258 RepID=UPI000865E056|nr:hypothetical protein [Cobetia marina]AOM01824.1 hypothetical protein BFX80_11655 [Cobetia marina]
MNDSTAVKAERMGKGRLAALGAALIAEMPSPSEALVRARTASIPWAHILLALVITRLAWLAIAAHGDQSYLHAMAQFDGSWFKGIMTRGYDVEARGMSDGDAANWAFFPLYPALLWLVTLGGQLDPELMGVLLSNVLLAAALGLGCRYLAITRPDASPLLFVWLVASMPYSFYFSALYSESLFWLLCLASLIDWRCQRTGRVMLWTLLLSMTRATGVFWVIAMGIELLARLRLAAFAELWRRPDWLLIGVMGPLGLFLFMAVLYHQTGDALAFSHVQISWGREMGNPIVNLVQGLGYWFTAPETLRPAWQASMALIGIALIGWLGLQRRWLEMGLAAFTLFIPLATGLDAIPRYLIGMPVFVLALLDLLTRLPSRLAWGLVALGALFNLWLVENWYDAAFWLV